MLCHTLSSALCSKTPQQPPRASFIEAQNLPLQLSDADAA
jgi:hypothetical protein